MSSAPFWHLTWQIDDDGEGHTILEAMASHRATDDTAQQATDAELQRVLAWAQQQFGHDQGPLDEGHAWDLDLQRHHEADGWHSVTLTIAATPAFHAAFIEHFGDPLDDED